MKPEQTGSKNRQAPGEPEKPVGERLQKILAAAGMASRRKAEEIILAGRVQVNGHDDHGAGHAARCRARPHPGGWQAAAGARSARRYYMLNKPRGYVTTLDDPQKRPTVMELMASRSPGPHGDMVRLYPVGRLDYLSEGLLLMTNDGELANSLSKAAAGVEKTYLVKVSGVPPMRRAGPDSARHRDRPRDGWTRCGPGGGTGS